MTYTEAVRFLYSLGNEVQTAKFGLQRISRLLKAMGSPHATGNFVHVAGTNGKGSTSAMIESGLRAAGQLTGLYTSPHLIEPVERIQIQGQTISPEQFARAFDQVHTAAERMLRDGDLDFHPTYFESVTAMAFLLFREASLDWIVLETGLGGRLDATNVVTSRLCVITPIAYDHQFFLGNTLIEIAGEKAGILKPGVAAVFAHQLPEAAEVLRERAQGPFTFTDEWPIERLITDAHGSRFRMGADEVVCPLAGEHQVENARTAALALRQLGYPADGIALTEWPGRLQRVSRNPDIILDGAHNPAGAHALAQYIERFYAGRTIWLIFGVMRDKPLSEIAGILFPLAQRIILTAPANSRALPPEQIAAPNAVITHQVAEALALVRGAPSDAVVFITGSLFVVGEALQLLRVQ